MINPTAVQRCTHRETDSTEAITPLETRSTATYSGRVLCHVAMKPDYDHTAQCSTVSVRGTGEIWGTDLHTGSQGSPMTWGLELGDLARLEL